jgi:hypothetical protein
VRIFKTKEFTRFARQEDIVDERLREAAERAGGGLIDADLGGGLIKQRIARAGQGRSGGYRTLMAFREKDRAVFIHGFAKNERANIGSDELKFWRLIAKSFLKLDAAALATLAYRQEITEVTRHDENEPS